MKPTAAANDVAIEATACAFAEFDERQIRWVPALVVRQRMSARPSPLLPAERAALQDSDSGDGADERRAQGSPSRSG